MRKEHIMLGVVLLIGIAATANMLDMRHTGDATYQQLVHRDYMIRRPVFDPCTAARCTMNGLAIQIATDLADNPICRCPDGERFIVGTQRRY